MPTKPSTTPAQQAEILELHASGYGGRKIAEITGVSYGRVRGVLERNAAQREAESRASNSPKGSVGQSDTSATEEGTPSVGTHKGLGPAVRVAVWDIETTDLKSDIGRLTVSSFYYPDEDRLETKTFRDFDDGELGLALWTRDRICELDFIIGHNVKMYDRNFLNGVLARHGQEYLPRRGWWDTLLIARYGLKGALQSNSMANLADVLGLDGSKYKPSKHDWRDVLVEQSALDEIVTRCEEDVLLNYRLWLRLKPYFHRWQHKHE